MIEIFPTNTCPPDLAELSRRSDAFGAFASTIHLDIDDAKFAPALSWPYAPDQWSELEEMPENGGLPFSDRLSYETHLMVEDPLRIGELLARSGCSRIMPHVEVFKDVEEFRAASDMWKIAGATEVGLTILLDTPLSVLDAYLPFCDAVQMMSIAKLGAQGAPFEESIFARIAELHAQYPELVIAVDGGVGEGNIAELVRSGARRFCVGSAIVKAPNPAEAYQRMIALAEGAL